MPKDLKIKCPDCDGGTVQTNPDPDDSSHLVDVECETCGGYAELNAYAHVPEVVKREHFKNQVEESAKALVLLAHALAEDPTHPKNANLFRADKVNMMASDLVKFRDALLDSYDVPFDEYHEKFRKVLREKCIELHGFDPAQGR
jgi:ribosomal protein S27E